MIRSTANTRGGPNGVDNAWTWTRLAYTYDWRLSATGHFGLSEFVIPSGILANQQGVNVPIEVVNIASAFTYGEMR